MELMGHMMGGSQHLGKNPTMFWIFRSSWADDPSAYPHQFLMVKVNAGSCNGEFDGPPLSADGDKSSWPRHSAFALRDDPFVSEPTRSVLRPTAIPLASPPGGFFSEMGSRRHHPHPPAL